MRDFSNEVFTNYRDEKEHKQMLASLQRVESQLGQEYPLLIGGIARKTEKQIISMNPSNKDQVIGYVSKADPELAEQAMQAALAAFDGWRHKSFPERARYLLKAAAIMRRRKHELSAWMCYEAGKTWAEADGDTAEAIDFLEFYAREAIRLGEVQPIVKIAGEDNEQHYIPIGGGL